MFDILCVPLMKYIVRMMTSSSFIIIAIVCCLGLWQVLLCWLLNSKITTVIIISAYEADPTVLDLHKYWSDISGSDLESSRTMLNLHKSSLISTWNWKMLIHGSIKRAKIQTWNHDLKVKKVPEQSFNQQN